MKYVKVKKVKCGGVINDRGWNFVVLFSILFFVVIGLIVLAMERL